MIGQQELIGGEIRQVSWPELGQILVLFSGSDNL